MRAALVLAAAATFGCASNAPAMNPPPTPSAPAPAPAPAECNAAAVQAYVGRPWDAGTAGELRARSGAAKVRAVRPGQMVTMEFDAARLTVELDASGRIAALRCG